MNCIKCGHVAAISEFGNPGWILRHGHPICPSCNEMNQIATMPEHDPVNHPKHYTSHPSGVECITITRHMPFNIGNAIKYLWRAGQKDSEIQDLEKAVWYIKDEIQRLQGKNK